MFRRRLKWWFSWKQWKWWLTPDLRLEDREGTSFRFLRGAGLVSIDTIYGSYHFGVYPSHWVWGHDVEEYDSCMEYLGLGPLFLVAKLT